MIKRLHHVGILTHDIEAAADRYRRLLDAAASPVRHVTQPTFSLWTTLLAAGIGSGSYVQLIQPEIGPGADDLAASGEGALYEIAFEVDDIAAASAAFRANGLTPSDITGAPIDGAYLVASSGNRYFYLSPAQTGGTHIEIIEVVAISGASSS
jgi:catechol 2,3-dioxygenase-like lactoylglutathione lyase family enzyme